MVQLLMCSQNVIIFKLFSFFFKGASGTQIWHIEGMRLCYAKTAHETFLDLI